MKIVVSNLWPRAKFYEDVPEIARKLSYYRGDPVIDACDELASIESFKNHTVDVSEFYRSNKTARSEDAVTEESDVFGGLSQDGIAPEILRQYVFFTMMLRALYLKNSSNISAMIGYCSGIIPVLNSMEGVNSSASATFQLPDLLLRQLSAQDATVANNVSDRDVVMSLIRLKTTGLTRKIFVQMLNSEAGRGVYVTDWKADNVAAVCATRAAMQGFLAKLEDAVDEPFGPIRLVPHGGLHTPLAAPENCFDLEGGTKWQLLFERVRQSGLIVWTSAGRNIDPDGGIAAFETVMRDTLFRCVQTGKLVEWLRASDEEVYCVGLPSVISDMFLGSGLRIRRDSIVGPATL